MRIPIDCDSSVPLYRQIQQFLREQIQSGALPPETRLPATRDLAVSLGLSRITVTNAYAELEADGFVYTRRGSGTFVAPPLPDLPAPEDEPSSAVEWPLWQQRLLSQAWLSVHRELDRLQASVTRPDAIRFSSGMGAHDLFPLDEFRRTLQSVLRRHGPACLGYGDRRGYPPLRDTIAQILTSQGIPTHPDHVLITSGSQQALALVARLLLRPDDVVMVETPTYSTAIDLFRSLDVCLLGVPVDEEGMQVDKVEDGLRTSRPRLIYTIPTFHNPTGACMGARRRRQLIALAERYNVPILEDDFAGELRYDGCAQPALKALALPGRVIYVRTFSKMLMPGLRVGFLSAEGPVYDRLVDCKRVSDLASSSLTQCALEAYITVGRYQAHLRRACQVYRRRRDAMLEALDSHMPPGTRWSSPRGGLFIWLQLPAGLSASQLYPLAAEEGVTFAPGIVFSLCECPQDHMRLNFALHPPDVIEEGIRRLGRAIERCLADSGGEVALVPRQQAVVV